MYKVILKFKTYRAEDWVIEKTFNDKNHCDNFIKGVCSRKDYLLDEIIEVEKEKIHRGNSRWVNMRNGKLLKNNNI